MAILEFENLSGGYGDTQVVKSLTGRVLPGQVLGVLGRNGVGKTTLARMLAGELLVQKGQIRFGGEAIETAKSYERRQLGLGYLSQTEGCFRSLTLKENFDLIENAYDPSLFFQKFPRLKERLFQKVGTMSGGEQKLAGFSRALMEDTKLVILDEPSEGVQQENIMKMAGLMEVAKRNGRSFLLIEQNLDFLMSVSDRVLALESGSAVLSGAIGDLSKQELTETLMV